MADLFFHGLILKLFLLLLDGAGDSDAIMRLRAECFLYIQLVMQTDICAVILVISIKGRMQVVQLPHVIFRLGLISPVLIITRLSLLLRP